MRPVVQVLVVALAAVASLAAGGPSESVIDAVKQGQRDVLGRLLTQGADANAAETDGTTPLHWAAYRSDAEAVELLIRSGAKANVTNRYGMTPLTLAAINGHAAIVERLLRAGADAKSALPGGETVLMTAARTGDVATVRELLAGGADLHAKEKRHGQTALMWAAAEGNTAVTQELIRAGADVNARSQVGFTPLLFAGRAGRIDTARALVEAGARVDDPLPNGMPPLTLALMNARYELASMLLDHGANPNADLVGWTALHQVAWTRRPNGGFNNPEPVQTDDMDGLELVRKLVKRGANPNARIVKEPKDDPRTGLNALNRSGATPFLLAAKGGDVELMRVLVELGADPSLANEDGTTPLMVAAGVGIFAPGEDPGTNDEALAAARLAASLGNDIRAADRNGETALHGAATRGATDLVRFLVERGARLDATNRRGYTPLRIAEGVMVGGTLKRQPETAALLRELMKQSATAAR